MLVCHCRIVSDEDIRTAIAAGARDEFDIAAACGAGTACGGCVPAITSMLAQAQGCAAGCPVVGALRDRARPHHEACAGAQGSDGGTRTP